MRVGIFGGSFNPPHVGHAMVAAWLRWADQADEVWLVPTYQHAFDKALAPFERRVEACRRLCLMLGEGFRVVPVEAELPVPSYTITTLRALAARHPGATLRLVLGADNLEAVPKWRDWAAIQRDFSPIVVGRGAHAVEGAPTFPDVSSTDVRARHAAGLPTSALVPRDVMRAWLGTPP